MNIKAFNQGQMKHGIYHGMKLVHVNVDQTQVFVMINNVGMVINVNDNAKN